MKSYNGQLIKTIKWTNEKILPKYDLQRESATLGKTG